MRNDLPDTAIAAFICAAIAAKHKSTLAAFCSWY
jgi:hypothetical protein